MHHIRRRLSALERTHTQTHTRITSPRYQDNEICKSSRDTRAGGASASASSDAHAAFNGTIACECVCDVRCVCDSYAVHLILSYERICREQWSQWWCCVLRTARASRELCYEYIFQYYDDGFPRRSRA